MRGVEEYLSRLRMKGVSRWTIYDKKLALKNFETFIDSIGMKDVRNVTEEVMNRFLMYLKSEYRTINNKLLTKEIVRSRVYTVCMFFKFMCESGYMVTNPAKGVVLFKVKRVYRTKIPVAEEVKKFLSAPDEYSHRGIRDRAILELMYSSALLRREVVNIRLSDVDLKGMTIKVVDKRGERSRVVPFGVGAKKAIEKYVKCVRPKYVTEGTKDVLFFNRYNRKVNEGFLSEMFKSYEKEANISPNALRGYVVVEMLKNGADIWSMQKFLGHNYLRTTQKYRKLMPIDLESMHNKFHPREKLGERENESKYRKKFFMYKGVMLTKRQYGILKCVKMGRKKDMVGIMKDQAITHAVAYRTIVCLRSKGVLRIEGRGSYQYYVVNDKFV